MSGKPNSTLSLMTKAEWDREVILYKGSNSEWRKTRAGQLNYTSADAYETAMRRHGIVLSVPISYVPRWDKPTIIKENCLVIFDTQIPCQDNKFMNQLLTLADAWHIKQGISGGDLFNMTAFSIFYEKPEMKIWAKERAAAQRVLDAMFNAIPDWTLVMGNHEGFLLKNVSHQLEHKDILRLIERVDKCQSTDYYWLEVHLAGSKWRISHPRNTSVVHGRVPSRLCDKYEINVASGHGHLGGVSHSTSGKYIGIDVGVTCDPMRLDYYAQRDSIRSAMNQGALILMEGKDLKCHWYWVTPNADFDNMARMYA